MRRSKPFSGLVKLLTATSWVMDIRLRLQYCNIALVSDYRSEISLQ